MPADPFDTKNGHTDHPYPEHPYEKEHQHVMRALEAMTPEEHLGLLERAGIIGPDGWLSERYCPSVPDDEIP